MPDLSFLNESMGLEYCAGEMDIYLEVLESYVEEDMRDTLNTALAAEDWASYRTTVHAVKSTSLTIGAEALSAEAKELEMAAAASDGVTVKAGHDKLIADYTDILEKISAALA